jgi:hypothetical protein
LEKFEFSEAICALYHMVDDLFFFLGRYRLFEDTEEVLPGRASFPGWWDMTLDVRFVGRF